jgi:predicted Zn-dependent peptidase
MKARTFTPLPLALMIFTLAGHAEARQAASFPSTPPKPGPARDFRVPEPKRFSLDNGLEVALVQWGNIPKARVTLHIRSGNAFEKAEEVWLSDLTGNLLREGTTTRTATAISEEAAKMGGSLDISVTSDRTSIGGDVLAEFAPAMVELVADVVRNPKFAGTELPRLKADLSRQLAVSLSEPQSIALEKFRAAVYGDHPTGRVFPTEAMIQGFKADQIGDFYKATYGAGRARLYIVGRFEAAAVEAAVRKAFAGWAKGTPVVATPPKPRTERVIHLVDRPGAVQSSLILGMPVIDPTNEDYVALTVMNALLGGSFGSRITKNIREDKGYTYSPYSEVSTRYRDAYWAQNAEVTTNVTGPSIKEILAEVDKLQAAPPSEQELTGIKNYLAGTFVLQNSSRAGITGQLAFMDLHGLPASYANEYVKKVHAVTPEKVTEMAKKYVTDDTATIVVVGDRKAIEDQLKPFGKVVIK